MFIKPTSNNIFCVDQHFWSANLFWLSWAVRSDSASYATHSYLPAPSLASFCWSSAGFSSEVCNVGVFTAVLEGFWLFLAERYSWTAFLTSAAVQRWRIKASCTVKGPSLVRRTPLHTAVLRSSSPTSCTTFRKYFWVSFRHCTSVKTEHTCLKPEQHFFLNDQKYSMCSSEDYLKWSGGAGSECNASLSEWVPTSPLDPVNLAQPSHRLPVSACLCWNTCTAKKKPVKDIQANIIIKCCQWCQCWVYRKPMAYINKAFRLTPSSIASTLSNLSCVMWSGKQFEGRTQRDDRSCNTQVLCFKKHRCF